MRIVYRLAVPLLTAVAAMATPPAALAASAVTFVASYGLDTNGCTRPAPCRTLNKALQLTALSGTVVVLDTADYGPARVYYAVSIVGEGDRPVLLHRSSGTDTTPTLTISPAYMGDQVSVRNLGFDGEGSAYAGIMVGTGSKGPVFISDVTVRNYRGPGIYVNTYEASRVYIKDTRSVGNGRGFALYGRRAPGAMLLDNCVAEANRENSVHVTGDTATATLYASSLAATPAYVQAASKLVSLGNNFIAGSVGPTSTVGLR